MKPAHTHLAFLLLVLLVMACLAKPSRAGNINDNPRYQLWEKFKEGSSNTVTADIKRGPSTIHIETTKTLISVSPENVVVETATTARVMGHTNSQPATRETISSKADNVNFKLIGETDVAAMGKTFKCKVYETSGVGGAPAGGRPATTQPAENTAKAYVNEDVPGGLVKLDVTGASGFVVTFVLTAMEVK